VDFFEPSKKLTPCVAFFRYQLEFNGDTLKGVTANAVHRAFGQHHPLYFGDILVIQYGKYMGMGQNPGT